MATRLLMPQATAVWLVDNTTLTFRQIAELCDMHELEIQGIADGEVAHNIIGQSPILSNQVTAEEIARCEADPDASIQVREREELPVVKRGKSRYTPIAKRRDKPSAIIYLLRHHPQLADSQIVRLIGTTRKTIEGLRNGTHPESRTLDIKDPVMAGLCTSRDLRTELAKADAKAGTETKAAPPGASAATAAGES